MSSELDFTTTHNHLMRAHKNALAELENDGLKASPQALTAFIMALLVANIADRSVRSMVPWQCVVVADSELAAGILQELQKEGQAYGPSTNRLGTEDE